MTRGHWADLIDRMTDALVTSVFITLIVINMLLLILALAALVLP